MTLKRWRVRASPGFAEEWLEADYSDSELELMRVLKEKAVAGDMEAANCIDTIHELKVLVGATIVEDEPEPDIPAGQLEFDLDLTRGYVASHHAPAAYEAADKTAQREGPKRVVSPNSDRHRMLAYYATGVRSTLIDAGVYAHRQLGVGKRTVTGWDTGRRRASELAEFGLLDQEIGDDGHAYYRISEAGRAALALVNSGRRWTG